MTRNEFIHKFAHELTVKLAGGTSNHTATTIAKTAKNLADAVELVAPFDPPEPSRNELIQQMIPLVEAAFNNMKADREAANASTKHGA